METLNLDINKTRRIVFNSITKKAIHNAIDNPREINYNLVNTQQARRSLVLQRGPYEVHSRRTVLPAQTLCRILRVVIQEPGFDDFKNAGIATA